MRLKPRLEPREARLRGLRRAWRSRAWCGMRARRLFFRAAGVARSPGRRDRRGRGRVHGGHLRGARGAATLLLERTRDGGRKILISGGGRCNVLPSRMDAVAVLHRLVAQLAEEDPALLAAGRAAPLLRGRGGDPAGAGAGVGEALPRVEQGARRARPAAGAGAARAAPACASTPTSWAWSRRWRAGPGACGWTAARRDRGGEGHRGDRRPVGAADGERRDGTAHRAAAGALAPRDLRRADPAHHRAAGARAPGRRVADRAPGGAAGARRAGGGGRVPLHPRGYSGPSVLDVSHAAVRARRPADQPVYARWTELDAAAWERLLLERSSGTVLALLRRHLPARLADTLLAEAGWTRRAPSRSSGARSARGWWRSSPATACRGPATRGTGRPRSPAAACPWARWTRARWRAAWPRPAPLRRDPGLLRADRRLQLLLGLGHGAGGRHRGGGRGWERVTPRTHPLRGRSGGC
jgi:hypothetical protein